MTAGSECRETRQSLGVYVLGAIDPAERAEVDTHLAGCPGCREELAGLAGIPALLHRVPADEVRRLAAGAPPFAPPPDELLQALLSRAAGVRRARRWRAVAAAAAVAVVALGAGAAGATALGGHAPSHAMRTVAETVSGTAPGTGIHLTVRYQPMAWGTAMSVQVTGVPAGTVCQFRVIGAAGHAAVVGGWRVSYREESAWYPVSTELSPRSIRGFQVTSNGKVLVSAAVR